MVDHVQFANVLIPVAILSFLFWRYLLFKRTRVLLPDLIKNGAAIVDVRSPEEFRQGSCPGSLNIPLGDLEGRVRELDHARPVVVCCATGSRSAMATAILKKNGFSQIVNAGSWRNAIVPK